MVEMRRSKQGTIKCVCDCQALSAGEHHSRVDVHIKDVVPTGATTAYAAPELLRSIQIQWMGAKDHEKGVMINGPAADMWSFGCVCYEMLTGKLPFLSDYTSTVSTPSMVPQELVPIYREYQSRREEHLIWV